MWEPKSSIPIGAKDEISLKGFTLGVKAVIEKSFSICPQVTNKLLWPCIGPTAEKRRIPLNLGSQFATLGANVPAFI